MKKTHCNIAITLLLGFVVLFSCQDDDNRSNVKLRDRQEVYDENIVEIEDYLKDHYLDTNDFSIKPLTSGFTSIWDDKDNPANPYPLEYITVKNDVRSSSAVDFVSSDQVDYKLYYIKISEGDGVVPTSIDSVYTAYKGWKLDNDIFDQNDNGVWFSYPEATLSSISGYRQILSQIKTEATDGSGTIENPDGSISHNGFGRVIVFVPSGLAYFSVNRPGIGQYRPIIFDIKLFYRKERDHDRDRVLSNFEDLNGDNNFYNDDTDGDNIPNFLDTDDDGDGRITKFEIRYEVSPGVYDYYNYSSIPNCSGGSIKKHLDPSCQ